MAASLNVIITLLGLLVGDIAKISYHPRQTLLSTVLYLGLVWQTHVRLRLRIGRGYSVAKSTSSGVCTFKMYFDYKVSRAAWLSRSTKYAVRFSIAGERGQT